MSFNKIPGKIRKFAGRIDPSQVKLIVVFSTSAKPSPDALSQFKAIFEPKGIKVHDEGFFCKASTIGQKFPGPKELKDAEEFGQRIGEMRVK